LIASLADAGRVITIDKSVFLNSANWDFDNAVVVFADDGFFGNNVGDVISNRFPYFLPVPQAITRAPITTLPR
jgi:hypothetical protein